VAKAAGAEEFLSLNNLIHYPNGGGVMHVVEVRDV
jgi:hypothetical protein